MHPWDSVAAVGLEVGTVLGFLAEFEANNATIFLKGFCSACSLLSTVVNFVMFIESQPLWSMHTQIHIAQCWNITFLSNTQIHISQYWHSMFIIFLKREKLKFRDYIIFPKSSDLEA